MIEFIAALPMYDWPEMREQTDAEWQRLRAALLAAGIDAPERLVRRNADLPAVPGGIRDATGKLIAPDPATLPPNEFDIQTLWRHPALLLAQTCWGPMELGLGEHAVVVGQPVYDGFEGGRGEFYTSAIVMRKAPASGGEGVAPPANGSALLPLEAFRGKRLAFNGPDSMSGMLGLTRDLEAAGHSLAIFADRVETGAHRASIVAVAEGRADVCAVDCRSWHLARHHEPRAKDVRVVGWTARRKGLPFITPPHTPAETVSKMRKALAAHR